VDEGGWLLSATVSAQYAAVLAIFWLFSLQKHDICRRTRVAFFTVACQTCLKTKLASLGNFIDSAQHDLTANEKHLCYFDFKCSARVLQHVQVLCSGVATCCTDVLQYCVLVMTCAA
jgi:hypothetical protein